MVFRWRPERDRFELQESSPSTITYLKRALTAAYDAVGLFLDIIEPQILGMRGTLDS